MSFRIAASRALLLTGSAFFLTQPAAAQDTTGTTPETTAAEAQAQSPAEPDSADSDIVVTARRVEESLQRVPASISAFNERALERIQAVDPTSLQGAVPNLNIVLGRGSSNATNIYIRGFGQPDALQTFDPAVGVYIDDVYLSRIRGTQMDLLDIERIEVLRGPQGTLYGKNTIGGALKVVTRRPGKDLRAQGAVTVGTHGTLEAKASASGPISDTLGVGFALLRSTRNGLVDDEALDRSYNDKDTFGGRVTLAYTPSSSARIDLAIDRTEDDANLTVGRPLNDLVTFSNTILEVENPGGGTDYEFEGRTTPGLPNSTKLLHRGISLTAAFDIDPNLTIKSITSGRKLDTDDYIDIDATQYEVGDVFVGVGQKQWSQEFQLNYSGEGFDAVGGLFYLHEDIESHQEAYGDDLLGPAFLNSTFLRTIDDELTTKSFAAYVNGSVSLTDALRLSGGLRYTSETKDYWRTTSTFYSPLLAAFNTTFVFSPERGEWKDWSPMVSLDYQVNPDVMLYGRIAKGFKSGGFNGRANEAASATEYKPEVVWSYEVGAKTRVARTLTLNGALFHNNYRDFQARVSGDGNVPTSPVPEPVLSVINAGKLRIRGAELEAAWTPIENLLLDTQVGYLDADYKEFVDVRFPDDSRAFQTPAFSPKWTMRFGGQYGFDLAGAGTLTVGGQSRYRARTALAVDNTVINYASFADPGTGTTDEVEGLFQNAFWIHDARVVWEDAAKRFSVGLFANNLTDKRYKTDGQDFSNIGRIRTVYYGNPRIISLRLGAKF